MQSILEHEQNRDLTLELFSFIDCVKYFFLFPFFSISNGWLFGKKIIACAKVIRNSIYLRLICTSKEKFIVSDSMNNSFLHTNIKRISMNFIGPFLGSKSVEIYDIIGSFNKKSIFFSIWYANIEINWLENRIKFTKNCFDKSSKHNAVQLYAQTRIYA